MASFDKFPSKDKILKRIKKYYKDAEKLLDLESEFDDLRDCTAKGFKATFMEAWTAIHNGNLESFKSAVDTMESQVREGNNSPRVDNFLNVCLLFSVVVPQTKEYTNYYMTLLAHAAVSKQKEIVEYLVGKKAKIDVIHGLPGSPLTQVLVYFSFSKCQKDIDISIFKLLIQGTNLSVKVWFHGWLISPVELAIELHRLDLAKLMVQNGAHPIDPHISSDIKLTGIAQVFDEYYEFGTNEFLSWLLNTYLRFKDDFPAYIDQVIKADVMNEESKKMFERVGRCPEHAILTCQNESMIKEFLRKYPHTRKEILNAKDANGMSALEIAAKGGDLTTVEILLKLGAQVGNYDIMDMVRALMLASIANNVDSMELILEGIQSYLGLRKFSSMEILNEHDGLSMLTRPRSMPDRELEEIMPDIPKDASEIIRDIWPQLLLIRRVVGSESAQEGILAILKVLFKWLKKDKNGSQHNLRDSTFELHISNTSMSLLKELELQIVEREAQPSILQHSWGPDSAYMRGKEHVNEWFFQACSYGSANAVRFFIEMLKLSATLRFDTPLRFACKNGRDDTVKYLLNLEELKNLDLHQPLIDASRKGCAKCVKLLLNHGAKVNPPKAPGAKVNPAPYEKKNALMWAIENEHSEVVLTILSDKKQCAEALKYCHQNKKPQKFSRPKIDLKSFVDEKKVALQECIGGKNEELDSQTTPMRALIKHMPEIAEFVLNQCVLEENSTDANSNEKLSYSLSNKFELLEDYQNRHSASIDIKKRRNTYYWGPNDQKKARHPLKLMVDLERGALLKHPLVQALISFKWKRIGIPIFVTYLLIYMIFLALLTAFTLVLPRPAGVSMDTGSESNISSANLTGAAFSYLYASSSLCILFSIFFLILEGVQSILRKSYLTDLKNYLQLSLSVLTVIFVFPAGHGGNWVLPSWRWEIGAVTIFFAWLNFIILLKSMRFLGHRIAMLFGVYLNFLKIIYLPILLILTFSFPLYMVLIFDRSSLMDTRTINILELFTTPITTIWNVLLQTLGDTNTYEIFNAQLLYPILTYMLFITFLIGMPILFNNFLIGMAVGETREEKIKASLVLNKERINYIFEIEKSFPNRFLYLVVRIGHHFSKWSRRVLCYQDDQETFHNIEVRCSKYEIRKRNEAILHEMEMKHYNTDTKHQLGDLKADLLQQMKSQIAKVNLEMSTLVAREITSLKEDAVQQLEQSSKLTEQALKSLKNDLVQILTHNEEPTTTMILD